MTPVNLSSVRRILNLAIVFYALGLITVFFRAHHTNYGNYMFMVMEIDHARGFAIERITICIFGLLTLINLFFPRTLMLIPIFLYILFEAWAGYYQGGYGFSEWTLGAQALRYTVPLSVIFLLPWPFSRVLSHKAQTNLASWALRIGLAVVFTTHGLECMMGNPHFIDLIIGSVNNLLGVRWTEATALQIMQVIGWVDIIVAIAVLIRPHKYLLAWIMFWSTITALSRMTALGSGAYTEVLMRASHILAPLAVYLLSSYLTNKSNKLNIINKDERHA
jgi:hypothetical protein